MDNLHPTLAAALTPLAPPPEGPRTAEYRAKLKRHDWAHEFSNEMKWVQRGRAELAYLRAERREIDPDFRVWNAVCHPWCRDGAAYPAFSSIPD